MKRRKGIKEIKRKERNNSKDLEEMRKIAF